jgi:hypothetical protein
VDTGAANSLLHTSVVNKLGLKYTPIQLTLATATGLDKNAIKGIVHLKFGLITETGDKILCCTNFLVSSKLNGLESILGSEFLFDSQDVESVGRKAMTILLPNLQEAKVLIFSDSDQKTSNLETCTSFKNTDALTNMTCVQCGNKSGKNRNNPMPLPGYTIRIKHAYWQRQHPELPDYESGYESGIDYEELSRIKSNGKFDLPVLAHTLKQQYKSETLPSGEELFDNSLELKFEILDKKLTIDDGDFSNCPKEDYPKIRKLLDQFEDRFSKTKLDIEVTDMYEAELETIPGKRVVQKVRMLPQYKYEFAMKAVRQLEKANVVRESDSPWRSNVVMVPKPVGKN